MIGSRNKNFMMFRLRLAHEQKSRKLKIWVLYAATWRRHNKKKKRPHNAMFLKAQSCNDVAFT